MEYNCKLVIALLGLELLDPGSDRTTLAIRHGADTDHSVLSKKLWTKNGIILQSCGGMGARAWVHGISGRTLTIAGVGKYDKHFGVG